MTQRKPGKLGKPENFINVFALQVNLKEKYFLCDFYHLCLNPVNFQVTT